jgi:hypothetical protein
MSRREWLKGWVMWGVGATVLSVLLGLGATTLISAQGGDGSLVHACVKRGTGMVRIVGPDDSCKSQETVVDWGITGPPGARGMPGPEGPPGPAGLAGLEVITESTVQNSDSPKSLKVDCPPGKSVIGGGARIAGQGPGQALTVSGPDGPTSWFVVAQEVVPNSNSWGLRADAFCATVAP